MAIQLVRGDACEGSNNPGGGAGLGAGAELQRPLALTVIGGLALSTPVTLLAVPGLYAAIKGRRG